MTDAPAASAAPPLRDALAMAAAELARAGVDTPRLDAELLLGSVLGVGRERLVIDASATLGTEPRQRFLGLIARRAAREPVAYILGHKGFRRITLSVDRRALIPRPETELLVEVGLSLPAGSRVLDVGTGSGAVALALKEERPDLDVCGSDVSRDALALARDNAAALGLDVDFRQVDLLAGLRGDAVLANLPYVAAGAPLAPEISRYEPPSALFAGRDGLDLIRRLAGELSAAEVSLVALEHGHDQADAVAGLLERAGFGTVARLRDLAGHDRVTVGRR